MKNHINPKKLMHSKWTRVFPVNKERHFIVSNVVVAENQTITNCQLEAVINKRFYDIDWRELKDQHNWMMGWK